MLNGEWSIPELPELEALAEPLRDDLTNRRVTGIDVRSVSILKTYVPPIEALVGDTVTGVRRRGKWLLVGTRAERTLAVHLMTGGRLRRTDGATKPARADALIVRLDDGSDLRVAEIGSKKRSAVHFVDGDGGEIVAHLGPEPLDPDFTIARLAAALAGRSQQLKAAIVDQRTLAGIGNAWSDEALHAARLSPLLLTGKLTADQVAALHAALRERLAAGIALARDDNYLAKLKPEHRPYLRVHGRAGQPCPDCQTPLAAIHFAERATTYCPACQVDGRVYADRRRSRFLK